MYVLQVVHACPVIHLYFFFTFYNLTRRVRKYFELFFKQIAGDFLALLFLDTMRSPGLYKNFVFSIVKARGTCSTIEGNFGENKCSLNFM